MIGGVPPEAGDVNPCMRSSACPAALIRHVLGCNDVELFRPHEDATFGGVPGASYLDCSAQMLLWLQSRVDIG